MLRFRNQQVSGIHLVEAEHRLDNTFQVWGFESEQAAVEQFVNVLESTQFSPQLHRLRRYQFTGGRGGGGWQCEQWLTEAGEIGYRTKEVNR